MPSKPATGGALSVASRHDFDLKAFWDVARPKVFKNRLTSSQVAGVEAILTAWVKWQPQGDLRFLAYMLATAFWETARTMLPIEEYGKGRGRRYGTPTGRWRQVYYGRGYVQLTWIANYQKATKELADRGVLAPGLDLARTPALALQPDIAAAIMIFGMCEGWFTSKKLSDYFGAKTDWLNARRIINAMDKASEIAGFAKSFHAALTTAARTIAVPKVIAKTDPDDFKPEGILS